MTFRTLCLFAAVAASRACFFAARSAAASDGGRFRLFGFEPCDASDAESDKEPSSSSSSSSSSPVLFAVAMGVLVAGWAGFVGATRRRISRTT